MRLPYLATAAGADPEIPESVWEWMSRTFDMQTRHIGPPPDALHACDPGRGRFSSLPILRKLAEICGDGGGGLLTFTEPALLIPAHSFTVGQAKAGGRVGPVSPAAPRLETHGLPPGRELLPARAAEQSLHEMGHAPGLIHCADPRCVMPLAAAIDTATPRSAAQVDTSGGAICYGCDRPSTKRLTRST